MTLAIILFVMVSLGIVMFAYAIKKQHSIDHGRELKERTDLLDEKARD
jgi:cbb3-type cytochrome oxidase subunit 3